MYSSTCFGRPHAHHQELYNCSSSLWFYRWNVMVAVLLVVFGPDHDQQQLLHWTPGFRVTQSEKQYDSDASCKNSR